LPNQTVVALKIWAYSPQNAKIAIFCYKFAPKRFLQHLDWGESPRFSH